MNLKTYLLAAIAATALAFTTPVFADAWDTAKAAAETYLETKYASTGVDNVTLTKSEFGNTSNKAAGHVVVDVLFDGILGGQLIYNPATASFDNFVNAGAGYSEPMQTEASLETCGPGHWFITTVGTNPDNNKWCTPAHLVGKSGGSTYISTTPGTPRSCEWTPNFRDTHSC